MAKVTEKNKTQKKEKVATPPVKQVVKKTSNADAKGRIVLGPQYANKMFRVTQQADGNLLLEPVVAIHEREVWFYRNPEVQAMVQEGIRQSRAGETVDLGSFAQYADLAIDDDEA